MAKRQARKTARIENRALKRETSRPQIRKDKRSERKITRQSARSDKRLQRQTARRADKKDLKLARVDANLERAISRNEAFAEVGSGEGFQSLLESTGKATASLINPIDRATASSIREGRDIDYSNTRIGDLEMKNVDQDTNEGSGVAGSLGGKKMMPILIIGAIVAFLMLRKK